MAQRKATGMNSRKGLVSLLLLFSSFYFGCDLCGTTPSLNSPNQDSSLDNGKSSDFNALPASQLCAGQSHTCVLKTNGQALCWGRNRDGQVGDGTTQDRLAPVPVLDLHDATQISCGYNHTCVRRRTGEVSCWGQNAYGQLGNNSTEPTHRLVNVSGINDGVEVAAGRDYTCVRKATGIVSCFGRNNDGQLGNGSTNKSLTPVNVINLSHTRSISAGYGHACAIQNDGTVVCWGRDNNKQLGRGGTENRATSPVLVNGIEGAIAVSAGGDHTCVLTDSGVFCWGRNHHGQIGNGQSGSGTLQATPSLVLNLRGADSLTLGDQHSCALLKSRLVQCWGYNSSRQLGHGAEGDQAIPVGVQGLTNIMFVAGGYSHTCALQEGGQIFCWGNAIHGQLGNGHRRQAHTPQPLQTTRDNLSPIPSVVHTFAPSPNTPLKIIPHLALGSNHVCTVQPQGTVRCFGLGGEGQLGHGSTRALASDSGVTVPGIRDAVQVSAYRDITCIRRSNGKIACWGALNNRDSSPEYNPSSLPILISGVDPAIDISVGGTMVCTRHRDGTVTCWGANNSGQLGNGTTDQMENPVQVQGITDAVQLASGQSTVCARHQSGHISCWGSGFRGALGTGITGINSPTPVSIPQISRATDIAAYGSTFCVVERGNALCWGGNENGELGNGRFGRETDANRPSRIRSLTHISKIGMGGGTVCAVVDNGSAHCWGANRFGQTGHNSTEPERVTSPWKVLNTQDSIVASFGNYTHITCGTNFCCGLHSKGQLSCQGSIPLQGNTGILGLGTQKSSFPIAVPGINVRPVGNQEPESLKQPEKVPTTTAKKNRTRGRRPECQRGRVRYSNCRLVYDRAGRPFDTCDCSPIYCCPGGRIHR